MLKLTVSPGEFLMIGDDIKIVFCGGEKNHIPIAVEAPKEKSIIRSSAVDRRGFQGIERQPRPYVEKPLSDEAKRKVTAIVIEDRWKSRQENRAADRVYRLKSTQRKKRYEGRNS